MRDVCKIKMLCFCAWIRPPRDRRKQIPYTLAVPAELTNIIVRWQVFQGERPKGGRV